MNFKFSITDKINKIIYMYIIMNPFETNDVHRRRKLCHLFFVVIFCLSLGNKYESVVEPLANIIRLISVKTALRNSKHLLLVYFASAF